MKVAIVGSRTLYLLHPEQYLPTETTEIVSGGAQGIDSSVKFYALEHHLKLTEFLPDYKKYGRAAPLKRNIAIAEYAEIVFAFWDGQSRGTKFIIDHCKKHKIPLKIFIPSGNFSENISWKEIFI